MSSPEEFELIRSNIADALGVVQNQMWEASSGENSAGGHTRGLEGNLDSCLDGIGALSARVRGEITARMGNVRHVHDLTQESISESREALSRVPTSDPGEAIKTNLAGLQESLTDRLPLVASLEDTSEFDTAIEALTQAIQRLRIRANQVETNSVENWHTALSISSFAGEAAQGFRPLPG